MISFWKSSLKYAIKPTVSFLFMNNNNNNNNNNKSVYLMYWQLCPLSMCIKMDRLYFDNKKFKHLINNFFFFLSYYIINQINYLFFISLFPLKLYTTQGYFRNAFQKTKCDIGSTTILLYIFFFFFSFLL